MCLARILIILILFGVIHIPAPNADPLEEDQAAELSHQWQILATGLELGIFLAPQLSDAGDSLIRVLRIDPQYFELKLLNASATESGRLSSAKEWCRDNRLVAAINASMFQTDYKTSVSLMRTQNHVNNRRLSKDMTILAFDRKNPGVPLVKIIDRQCDDFENWKQRYGTLIQSIRMISCTGRNVWSHQPQKWSTASIGMDKQGWILFIHVRSPYSTHDLINILKMLPIDIDRAMYVEGGPQAQLYVRSGDQEHEFVGGYSTNNNKTIENPFSWSIPNVVGIASKKAASK
jgi:hypothetical protein